MCRLLLRPVLLLALLAALPILLIRAQPYDDSELRAFLLPPAGCPVPCFLGIRPGVTTSDDAAAMLGAQALTVDRISPNPPSGVRFRGSSSYGLVEPSVFSYMHVENDVIQWMRIQTNISLGEVWAAFGQPDWGARAHTSGSSLIHYTIGYNQAGISFEFAVNIEQAHIESDDIFRKKLTLRIGDTMNEHANMPPRLWLYTSPDLSWWHGS